MNNIKEKILAAFAKESFYKAKAARYDEKNYLTSMILWTINKEGNLSPGGCQKILYNHYGLEASTMKILNIYRDLKINQQDKRQSFLDKGEELAQHFLQALEGHKEHLDQYRQKYRSLMGENENYRRLLIVKLFYVLPGLEPYRQGVFSLGHGYQRFMLNYFVKAISTNYQWTKQTTYRKLSAEEITKLQERAALLESSLEQTNILLEDLQQEFDQRLNEVKTEELTAFFAKLNSDKYGRILDELLNVRSGLMALRKKDYQLPLEINGMAILIKKLISFIQDNKINPILKPDSQHLVKAQDVELWDYEGSPFENNETKLVRVIYPGWVYAEKDLQIGRPMVKEVKQHD